MNLVLLEDFLALARLQSFSKAAVSRHVTQPAFSRRIRSLEDWVGTPLFVRTSHSCTLTAAGECFYGSAAGLVAQFLELRESALASEKEELRTLRFAVTQTLAFKFFPGWISKLGALTDFVFQLNSGNLSICEQLILEEHVHFLLCHVHPDVKSALLGDAFQSVQVGEDSLVLVSGVDAEGKAYFRLGEKQALPYLGYTSESGIGRIVDSQGLGCVGHYALKPVFTTHLAAALLPLAHSGQGVAWLPLSLVGEEVRSRELLRLLPKKADIYTELRLFRSTGPLSDGAEKAWASAIASSLERT